MFSLKQISEIMQKKHYFTQDRVVHLFTLRYGYTELRAKEVYHLFSKFPMIPQDGVSTKVLEDAIPRLLQLWDEIYTNMDRVSQMQIRSEDKLIFKIVYLFEEKVQEVVINMYSPSDVITYAQILENKEIKILAFLPLCDEHFGEKTVQFFEGDICNTSDKYYSNTKSRLFVAQKNTVFKQLMYIKGKGYLLNGKPNYSDEKFNYCAISMENYFKIGNIFVDASILKD
jgi:hypothetical protein